MKPRATGISPGVRLILPFIGPAQSLVRRPILLDESSPESGKHTAMNTRTILSAACALGLFTMAYLPPERLSAQGEGESLNSPPIEMVVSANTSAERWRTSHNGIMGPVSLLPDKQVAIALNASRGQADNPVSIAPLDGGSVIADNPLRVDDDGMVYFTFEGGNSLGLYRVVVTIGSERYQLLFYVVNPESVRAGCQDP
ncbi:MAG: hypothetical protein WAO00_20085 [Chthoniobacterales bacterium]